jgi:hypothetical protein
MDGERGDLVQVVQDEDDRRAIVGQSRRNLSRHGLHVLGGDDMPQTRGRPLTDDRGERGRHRDPQGPHIVLGRAQRDPRSRTADSALGQPGTDQQRLPPTRRRRDQRAGALQACGQPRVQAGTRHHMRGQRHRELEIRRVDRGGGAATADSHPGRVRTGHPDTPTMRGKAIPSNRRPT